MIKFIINENPSANGVYQIHNATKGCENLTNSSQQILIGYFANIELALKRAKMNWSKEKIQACTACCTEQ